MLRLSFPLLAVLIVASVSAQAPKKRRGLELFEKRIRPALIQYCYECHAADSDDVGGKLLLDTRAALLRGGDAGPSIVPGKPRDSLLIRAIEYRDIEMPPDEKLPNSVISDFKRWIALGAPDPRTSSPAETTKKKGGPSDTTQNRAEQPVDLWSLQPVAATAPPSTDSRWPRTAADAFILDKLTEQGLQPNGDAAPKTLLRRVYFDLIGLPPSHDQIAAFVANPSDRHLESIVDRLISLPEFGERWGRHWLDIARYAESTGSSRDVLMLYAWRYRDYVIDAFNADVPFDRFVIEQVAGDLLPFADKAERRRLVIATGLLAIGSKSLNGGNLTYDVIDDQIDVLSKSVLGLTVSCARCHDHKFDPIPTTDYYSLAGIFLSTDTRYGGGTKRPKSDKDKSSVYLSLHQDLEPDADPCYAIGVQEAAKIRDARVLIRGEKGKTGKITPRGFLTAVDGFPPLEHGAVGPIDEAQSGRRQLAHWLVHPDNPLTPRVAVNRIWQHLMGDGLVSTVDNFGVSGLPPSHPRLLDHLATRFVHTHRWSTKAMVRELILSRTYRLSNEMNQSAYAVDPDNRLRWRMPRRRLEAEPLRDAMLAVTGLLRADRPQGSLVMEIGEGEVGRNIKTAVLDEPFNHRSVYLPIIRGIIPEQLRIFDLPEPSNVQGLRDTNTTPTQALFFMNSDFSIRVAKHLADGLLTNSLLNNDQDRIRAAHLRCFGSLPTQREADRAIKFITTINNPVTKGKKGKDFRRRLALATYCQTLIASARFRFVD